jgi:hypothetical protein
MAKGMIIKLSTLILLAMIANFFGVAEENTLRQFHPPFNKFPMLYIASYVTSCPILNLYDKEIFIQPFTKYNLSFKYRAK